MAESKPAPGELELIRAFVNTRELDPMRETLTSPDALRTWLAANDLAGPRIRVSRDDLALAIRTREAIRSLLLANNGRKPSVMDTTALDDAARAARFSLHFDATGAALQPESGGVAGALGRLLSIIATSMTDGSWTRFKACGNDECEWGYYDYSRNRSRRWCEMAVCGNRMKARSYRMRRAADAR